MAPETGLWHLRFCESALYRGVGSGPRVPFGGRPDCVHVGTVTDKAAVDARVQVLV